MTDANDNVGNRDTAYDLNHVDWETFRTQLNQVDHLPTLRLALSMAVDGYNRARATLMRERILQIEKSE
jgi:hypothetical protein